MTAADTVVDEPNSASSSDKLVSPANRLTPCVFSFPKSEFERSLERRRLRRGEGTNDLLLGLDKGSDSTDFWFATGSENFSSTAILGEVNDLQCEGVLRVFFTSRAMGSVGELASESIGRGLKSTK